MTLRTLRIAPVAAEQMALVRTWWRNNRPSAPELFERELNAALDQVERDPSISTVFERVDDVEIRRVLLRRCRYALYFAIDPDGVLVVALWHTSRGSGPPLR